jgi:hypothetical protein
MPSRLVRPLPVRQSALLVVSRGESLTSGFRLPRTDVCVLYFGLIGAALGGPACSSHSSGNGDSSTAGMTGTAGVTGNDAGGSGPAGVRAGSSGQGQRETAGAPGTGPGHSAGNAGANGDEHGGEPNLPVNAGAGAAGTGETGESPGAAGQGEGPLAGAGGDLPGAGGSSHGAAGAAEGGGDAQEQGEPGPIGTGDIATATIGPSQAGPVELESVSIMFPAGLSAQADVQIESTTEDVRGDFQRYTPVYRFTPEGLSGFMAFVTFTVPADAIAPAIYWSKPNGEPGFDRLSAEDSDGQLMAQVSHFSQGFVAGPAVNGPGGVLVTGGVRMSGALAVDGDNVYFTDDYNAMIYGVPVSGGVPIALPHDGVSLAGAAGIVLQGSDLYVVDSGGIDGTRGRVVRLDLAGNTAAVVGGDPWVSGLKLDVKGDALYWISGNSAVRNLRRFPLPDGPVETIGGGQDGAGSVTTDNDWVYYADSRGIQRVGRDGQGQTTLVGWVNGGAHGLVVQDGFIYLLENEITGTANGERVLRFSIDQTGQSLDDGLELASGLQEPLDMALDGGFVYYLERGARDDTLQSYPDGKLSKVPADGSAAPTTLGSGLQDAGCLAVQGSSVYYTLVDSPALGGLGLMRRLDK